MPKNCLKCPIGKNISIPLETCIQCPLGKCAIDEETRTRPNWCPLKPAPQKQPTEMKTINDDINKLVFNEGYNTCIDEILGDKEREDMKIDYSKLEKKHWFEDENGNEISEDDVDRIIKKGNKHIYYRRCFPLELHDMIDEYCYHPKNPIIKFLCRKSKRFYNWISVGKDRTFKPIMDGTTSFGSKWSQECIVAMVNSGDFTLEQAIWVYANSCERCMNVLLYKYLDGKDGYEEYSEEWKKANTVCDFCKYYDKE